MQCSYCTTCGARSPLIWRYQEQEVLEQSMSNKPASEDVRLQLKARRDASAAHPSCLSLSIPAVRAPLLPRQGGTTGRCCSFEAKAVMDRTASLITACTGWLWQDCISPRPCCTLAARVPGSTADRSSKSHRLSYPSCSEGMRANFGSGEHCQRSRRLTPVCCGCGAPKLGDYCQKDWQGNA